jgi:alcohol dehydrogenase class IV
VTGAAHGLLCGLLLPPVMRFNREAAGAKYAVLARELGLAAPGASDAAAAEALLSFTEGLLQRVGIPARLREIGFVETDLEWVAQETLPSGSTKANPRPVTHEDAAGVALSCL